MNIKNVTVCGGGVLGSQIAFQSAYSGFDVTIWLLNDDLVKETKERINNLSKMYIDYINIMDTDEGKNINNWMRGIVGTEEFDKNACLKKVQDALKKISYEIELKSTIINADLVIESIIENKNIKIDFYKTISPFLKDDALVVTNSSTMLPSTFAKYIKKEDKFLALHFANSIWKNNTAEIMAHKNTDKTAFNEIIKFAKNINMIPLPLYKEKSGYLLNSMLIPLLFSGLDLLVNEISDVESIDKAWTIGTGSPKGPFQILDTVGLNTAYNIVSMYTKIPSFIAPYNFKAMEKLLKKYIDEGKLGFQSKEGFYKYN